MVPVVLGASMENVRRLLPPNSFIHVENFTGPADLANCSNTLMNTQKHTGLLNYKMSSKVYYLAMHKKLGKHLSQCDKPQE